MKLYKIKENRKHFNNFDDAREIFGFDSYFLDEKEVNSMHIEGVDEVIFVNNQ